MRSRRRHEEHENHERWLVSYADFITLLFAFFVVMYATSNKNEEKEKKFEDSIRKEMKMVLMTQATKGMGAGVVGDLIDPLDMLPRRSTPEEAEVYVDKKLKQLLPDYEKQGAISSVRHDTVGVRISLASSSFFASGSHKLQPSALKSLDKLAVILKSTNNRVIIEGHTDDLPVNNTVNSVYESNWELSSLRATTVLRYLNRVHGIPENRMTIAAYADTKPLVQNDSEEHRSKNRRIEILIVAEGQSEKTDK